MFKKSLICALQGIAAERIIQNKYRSMGFKVKKIVIQKKTKHYYPLSVDWKNIKFLLKREGWDISSLKVQKLKCDLEKEAKGLPDFILIKEGVLRFIESKSNGSGVSDQQEKRFQELRNEGYDVQIEDISVKIDIDLKDETKAILKEKKTYSLEDIRQKFPKAYLPWGKLEEYQLFQLFSEGRSIKEIANILGRQNGGIISRLKKNNLIE